MNYGFEDNATWRSAGGCSCTAGLDDDEDDDDYD
jgi:hypothetical protein